MSQDSDRRLRATDTGGIGNERTTRRTCLRALGGVGVASVLGVGATGAAAGAADERRANPVEVMNPSFPRFTFVRGVEAERVEVGWSNFADADVTIWGGEDFELAELDEFLVRVTGREGADVDEVERTVSASADDDQWLRTATVDDLEPDTVYDAYVYALDADGNRASGPMSTTFATLDPAAVGGYDASVESDSLDERGDAVEVDRSVEDGVRVSGALPLDEVNCYTGSVRSVRYDADQEALTLGMDAYRASPTCHEMTHNDGELHYDVEVATSKPVGEVHVDWESAESHAWRADDPETTVDVSLDRDAVPPGDTATATVTVDGLAQRPQAVRVMVEVDDDAAPITDASFYDGGPPDFDNYPTKGIPEIRDDYALVDVSDMIVGDADDGSTRVASIDLEGLEEGEAVLDVALLGVRRDDVWYKAPRYRDSSAAILTVDSDEPTESTDDEKYDLTGNGKLDVGDVVELFKRL